jgi:hypothetical protein
MGSVRLYAIAIDEVRDIFRAGDDSGSALRAIAAERFGDPTPPAPGLLGKLGPVFRRAPDAPVLRPDLPSGSDVDTMLSGRYVPPHRLGACWILLEAWVDALAWGSVGRDCTEAQLDDFDFALVRAGVPAQFGLRALLRAPLGIAMLPHPGTAVGWVSGEHVTTMARAWRPAVPGLEEPGRGVAEAILAWLDLFGLWTAQAADAQRQAPDLVAVLHA